MWSYYRHYHDCLIIICIYHDFGAKHCSSSLFKGRSGNICYAIFTDLSIFNQPPQSSMLPQLSLITIIEWTYGTQTRHSRFNEENVDSKRKISIYQAHLLHNNRPNKQTSAAGCRIASKSAVEKKSASRRHMQAVICQTQQSGGAHNGPQ